jgi:hypothetical protein
MISQQPHPADMPIACIHCGEVTKHRCPYAYAPLSRWACERAHEHEAPAAAGFGLFFLRAAARAPAN